MSKLLKLISKEIYFLICIFNDNFFFLNFRSNTWMNETVLKRSQLTQRLGHSLGDLRSLIPLFGQNDFFDLI